MKPALVPAQVVIGLEVHARLLCTTKLMSPMLSDAGGEPNTRINAYDIAMPGSLPVLNRRAVELAIRFALATEGQVQRRSVFERKHYHYPDLPKGYQISQYQQPIVTGGRIPIEAHGATRFVSLTRAHLEEDAGKLLHENMPLGFSGVDLNRAGAPLLEIVSEPEIYSADEAVSYLKELHSILLHRGICDGNMQDGSFRCDVNLSITPDDASALGTRTELKNINSFRFIHQAIESEIARQRELLGRGERVVQATRGFDSHTGQTFHMRDKEDAVDYRYFPDPDLPPLLIDQTMIDAVQAALPPSARERSQRYTEQHGLDVEQAARLTAHPDIAALFERCLEQGCASKEAFQWITQGALSYLQRHQLGFNELKLKPAELAKMLHAAREFGLAHHQLKPIFQRLCEGHDDVMALLKEHGLDQKLDQDQLAQKVAQVLEQYPEQLKQLREGNEKVGNFLLGKIMAALKSSGGVDAAAVRRLLQHQARKEQDA